jgi:hypothetical protein
MEFHALILVDTLTQWGIIMKRGAQFFFSTIIRLLEYKYFLDKKKRNIHKL